jgi:hypothetical protein
MLQQTGGKSVIQQTVSILLITCLLSGQSKKKIEETCWKHIYKVPSEAPVSAKYCCIQIWNPDAALGAKKSRK